MYIVLKYRHIFPVSLMFIRVKINHHQNDPLFKLMLLNVKSGSNKILVLFQLNIFEKSSVESESWKAKCYAFSFNVQYKVAHN